MSEVDSVVRVIEEGGLAVLPTDTVYGLVCTAFDRQAAMDLYRLKGRVELQPTALVAASLEALLEFLPELEGRSALIAGAVLPGPYTLVLPNPGRRFGWLSESRPGTIGVRVPALVGPAAAVVQRLGAIVATSANVPGGPDPRRLEEVPAQIRAGVAAALDGGELPGTPSTVIDVTGAEPVILRAGAGDPDAALACIAAAYTQSLPPRDDTLTGAG